MGNIKIKVFDSMSYSNYIADNLITSYVRYNPNWSNYKTDFGILEIQVSTAPISAPGPGENPFDATAPIQGYRMSLNNPQMNQSSCVKTVKNFINLDYMIDMNIGDETIYYYLDGDKNSTGKELNDKIISSCEKMINREEGRSTNIGVSYTYDQYL